VYIVTDMYRVGKKTAPFLNVDDFAMVSGTVKRRVICQKFANFV